jgi:hypothetical protein
MPSADATLTRPSSTSIFTPVLMMLRIILPPAR